LKHLKHGLDAFLAIWNGAVAIPDRRAHGECVSVYAQFKTYLSAAQTAFLAGDYTTTRQQLIVAEIELAKVPDAENQGEKATFRENLNSIRAALVDSEARAGSRKNQLQFATLTPKSTSSGSDDDCP
jgi:hypothetical protein